MTRVLYINQAGDRGGAETVLLNILTHIDRSRFEPSVVCLQDGPFVNALKRQAAVDVQVIPMGRFRNPLDGWRVIRALRNLIRSRRIDLVHSNGTGAHLYGGLAARLSGVPNIYHVHDLIEWSWSAQGLIHLAALMIPSDATVAVSEYSARRFKQSWHSSRAIDVIHNAVNPVDAIDFDGPPPHECEDWFQARSPIVTWCGRLQRWKGAHIFLEAAALVRQRVPDARFLVVGGTLFGLDSEYEQELRALASKLNLDGCLRFTGQRPDAQPYMAAAELIVHSSITPDPFGLVVLESMVLARAVIASADGGPAEIVEHESTGLLVPPRDPDALAAAMIRLLEDDALRDTMGAAGRERARNVFGFSRMMQKIEGLYCRLVDSTAPATHHLASSLDG